MVSEIFTKVGRLDEDERIIVSLLIRDAGRGYYTSSIPVGNGFNNEIVLKTNASSIFSVKTVEKLLTENSVCRPSIIWRCYSNNPFHNLLSV